MKELITINIIKQIDAEIQNQTAGTPGMLGKKVNRKESSVHNYIRIMKLWGAPIKFCRQLQTYVYTEKCDLFLGYIMRE